MIPLATFLNTTTPSLLARALVATAVASVVTLLILLTGCGNSQRAPTETSSVRLDAPVELNAANLAAARLLLQASFGPTEEDIRSVVQLGGAGAWIDAQMRIPTSRQLPYVQANSNGSRQADRHYVWWENVVQGPDQLRQRVAFALSQIFVVSDIDYTLSNAQYSMASYYDMLADHAFGSYRELLEAVTLHPAMGVYLSMVRNEPADEDANVRPDENYAREVLQLFSIGLFSLDSGGLPVPPGNPEPTYTQETVEEFARVFTGWNFDNTDQWQSPDLTPFDKVSPMVPWEQFHDQGTKVLLNGMVLESGQDTRTDLEAALDNISAHPNVGPFFSRLLIQRLIGSNPSPDYVERVATVFNDNGSGQRGDLAAVVRAILLDDDARQPVDEPVTTGKFKEPVLRLTHVMRALHAQPGAESDGVLHTATKTADRVDEIYGQAVMRSPSVFNFFQPDNVIRSRVTLPDGRIMLAPEQQILTEANVAAANNDLHILIYDHHNRSTQRSRAAQIQVERAILLVKRNPQFLLDYLNLLFLGGEMSDTMNGLLLQHMETLASNAGFGTQPSPENTSDAPADANTATSITVDDDTALQQVLDSLFVVVASPEFLVQR